MARYSAADSSYDWFEFRQLDTSCGWFYLSYGWLEFRRLDTSCGWLYPTTDSSFGGWIRVTADSSSGGWIRVAADSILRLTRVPAAGYELRLIPSPGWFEFQCLDSGSGCCFKKLEEAWRSFKTLAATDSSCDGGFESCDQLSTPRILTPIPSDTDVWKLWFTKSAVRMNGCSFQQVLRQNFELVFVLTLENAFS